MAIQSLTDLKALINSTIQDNTTNDISGSDVQTALINAIDTLDSLEGFINVHKANGQTTITAYGSKALARAAVPDDCKKEGVVIAYKISTGWLIEQNLDATAGTWGDDASWQTVGPVSVSQNTESGNLILFIGSNRYNVSKDDFVKQISWSDAKQHRDSIPLLESGEKYYFKINSLSATTRVQVGLDYDGYNSQYIGMIAKDGNYLEVVPDGNKNNITVTLVDVSSGSIDYTIFHYGELQKLDERVKNAENGINQNTTNITNIGNSLIDYKATNDKKVNTIQAEQDYVENIVASVTGSDYANYIEMTIPKGEVFLAYADFGSISGSTNIVLKLNTKTDSGDVVARLNDKEWTLIKPSVDVAIIGIFFYRTSVTSSANGTLKIRKLQSITADGKLPLYDGGLSANGTTFANGNRKNTRVILNDRPLLISLNAPFQLTYLYGNEPDNMTDGGYISNLNHTGKYVLDINYKYVGFTIVKPSNESFDNLQLFIFNNNSSLSTVRNTVDSNKVKLENESLMGSGFPFISGGILETTGERIENTKRITSQVVWFKGTIIVKNDTNKFTQFLPIYREKGTTTFVSQGWKVNAREYALTGEGEFYVMFQSAVDVTPSDAANIEIYVKNSAKEITNLPVYNLTVIGAGSSISYDECNIVLRKGCVYRVEFESDTFNTNATGSTEILNIGAYNVNDPEQSISIAYKIASSPTVPTAISITMPYDGFVRYYCHLTKDSYLNVKITQVPSGIKTVLSELSINKDKLQNLLLEMKAHQFFDGDLLTEVKDILTFGGGFDLAEEKVSQGNDVVVNIGDFYVGLSWAENAAGEYQQPHYNVGLITGNLLDVAGTKERYIAANYGDVILDGYTYDAISGEAIAKRISNTEVAVFVGAYYLNGVGTAATRIFNLVSKTWGDFQKCYLNVDDNGTNRRFQMRDNETDMREIHSITGMHNFDDVAAITGNNFGYYASNNPIKIGQWFWLFMDIGNYAPALVKTQDFIDFYFVCELPFGTYKEIDNEQVFVWNPTEEVAIEYFNNRIYAVCRGNKGRFTGLTEGVDYYGYNQIMSANFDDINNGTQEWEIVNLEPYWYEKPAIVAFNGFLYCYNGARGTWSYKGVEGKNLNRFKHMFYIFDRDLNILKQELLNSDDGYLHPAFMKYGNAVYSLNCTDWRNLTYFDDGNNRSELRLKRLDMLLLGL